MKYTCSIETVQQNGRFTLFPSKFEFYSLNGTTQTCDCLQQEAAKFRATLIFLCYYFLIKEVNTRCSYVRFRSEQGLFKFCALTFHKYMNI